MRPRQPGMLTLMGVDCRAKEWEAKFAPGARQLLAQTKSVALGKPTEHSWNQTRTLS